MGTILADKYPYGPDSRLVSPQMTLDTVAANEEIVLRYNQWWSYSGGDRGYVQIQSYDEGTETWSDWTTLKEVYSYDSTWHQALVDLTAYAGQTIRLGFYHTDTTETTSYGSNVHAESWGWYLDDVEIIQQTTPQFTGFDDFESGWGGWWSENGIWELGEPTAGPDSAYSGTNVMGTILADKYPYGPDSRLVSPQMTLDTVAANEEIVLRYNQWWSYSGGDRGYVQIQSYDEGTETWSDWTTLKEVYSYDSTWHQALVDLTAYAGQTIRLGFYHTDTTETTSYGSNVHAESWGWYLDDVEMSISVLIPPVVTIFSAADPTETTSGYTNQRLLDVQITDEDEDGTVVAWMITETDTVPDETDTGWLDSRPTEYTIQSEGDGEKILYAWVKDNRGLISSLSNVSQVHIILDTLAPEVAVDTLATNDNTPALTGTINEATSELTLVIASHTYHPVNQGDGTWLLAEGAITVPLADGTYDVQITAIDLAGNSVIDLTSDELIVETVAPAVTIDLLTTNDNTPALTGEVDDPLATVEVSIAGQLYDAVNQGDGTWVLSDDVITPVLADGTYDVVVQAVDVYGNQGVDNTVDELLIDATGPQISLMTPVGIIHQAVESIQLTFDEEIAENSFTTDDIVLTGPELDSISVTLVRNSATQYSLSFDTQHRNGEYQLQVGPGVEDLLGNDMTRNAGGVFTGSFEITLPDLYVGDVQCPLVAEPGTEINLEWTVLNQGTQDASGAWQTQIYLSDDAVIGDDQLLTTIESSGTVPAANATGLAQSTSIQLPYLDLSGEFWLVVALQTNDEGQVFDANVDNNAALAEQALFVPIVLALDIKETTIKEDRTEPVRVILSRTGKTTDGLEVTLSSSDSSELTLPDSIIIPAGHLATTFTMAAVNDGVVDEDALVAVSAFADDAYGDTEYVLVENVQLPTFTIALDKDEITEGAGNGEDQFNLTITRDFITDSVITVGLSVSNVYQISVPFFTQIPANEASVTVEGYAYDDTVIEASEAIQIDISASGYNSAATSIQVHDDDVPAVVVNLERTIMSESEGTQAIVGTVSRGQIGDQDLRIRIDSSDESEALVPYEVIVPAGQIKETFYVTAVDDELIDGIQQVALTPSIILSSYGDEIALEDILLDVLDDDGPTLLMEIDRTQVVEGVEDAAQVTIRRTTSTDTSLDILLTSSDTAELTLPRSVTISIGQDSVSVMADSIDDGVVDGDKTVMITAAAEGYNMAVGQVIVTDRLLPDLVVTDIVAPQSTLTETYFDITYRTENQGYEDAEEWTEQVWLSDDPYIGEDTLLGTFTFEGSMPHTSGLNYYERTVSLLAPLQSENYWLVVETDVANDVPEIIETNNTTITSEPLFVEVAYTATVQTEIDQAAMGSPISMTGTALSSQGSSVSFVPVNIHIQVRQFERVITAITDENGQFSVTWNPLPTEAGHYTIGACHPGTDQVSVQDEFDLVGLRVEPNVAEIQVIEGQQDSCSLVLENLSEIPLTGLEVDVLDKPDHLDIAFNLSTTELAGLTSSILDIIVKAQNDSVLSNEITLRVRTDEAQFVDIVLNVEVIPAYAKLSVTPSLLQKSMLRGEQAFIEFEVSNIGGQETGPVEVLLPDLEWMNLVTSSVVESLEPGESVFVTIQLLPPENMDLTEYGGTLVLTNHAGVHLSVPYQFRAVSDLAGDLAVMVVDENYYFTEDKSGVSGATVILRDAITSEILVEGSTDENGGFLIEAMPEGYYILDVNADKHFSESRTIFLEAETVNVQTVFIVQQLVEYSWQVEKVELEDRYEVVLKSTFESNVQAPVVVLDPAVIDLEELKEVGQTMQVDMKLTNYGLIAAQDLKFYFGTHPYYEIKPLVDMIDVLPAKSSFMVPVVVTRIADKTTFHAEVDLQSDSIPEEDVPCEIWGDISFFYPCGPDDPEIKIPIWILHVEGDCYPDIAIGSGSGMALTPGVTGVSGGYLYFHPPSLPVFPSNEISSMLSEWHITPTINEPVDLCDIKCKTSTLSFKLSEKTSLLRPVLSQAENLLVNLFPQIEELESKLFGEIKFTKCCDSDETSGDLIVEGSAGLQVTGKLLLGYGGSMPWLKNLTTDKLPGYTIDVEVDGGIGLFFEVSLTAALSIEQSCDDPTPKICIDAEVKVKVIGGVDATASLTLMNGTDVIIGTGKVRFGVTTGVTSGVKYCLGSGWSGEICWSGVSVETTVKATITGLPDFTIGIEPVVLANPVCFPGDGLTSTGMDYLMGIEAEDLLSSLEYQPLAEQISNSVENSIDDGVCAKVKIALDQTAVMTRTGFKATLTLKNRSDLAALENVSVDVYVLDEYGEDKSDLFSIQQPSLNNLTNIDGSGILLPGYLGSSSWLIIPTEHAALNDITFYRIAGALQYDLDGINYVVPLESVSIAVFPDAALELDYFLQRDVLSDDPLTDEVESTQPFELAVMVQNNGAGTARNLEIESAQPTIVENEKGLLVDFKIIGTEVDGENIQPSLTANFGDVSSGETKIARWWMTSTLQGQFIDYEASYLHIDGLGDERLSLIKNVEIHELIHTVMGYGSFDDDKPDFLVNDLADDWDLPDTLYMSDGSIWDVALASNAAVDGQVTGLDRTVELTLDATEGWSYLLMADPGGGDYQLVSVVRHNTDGSTTELPVENFWQTDRTFIGDGEQPIYENMLHLCDYASDGVYTLYYEPRDQVGPTVVQITGTEGSPSDQVIDALTVQFSESVNPATFTSSALNLQRDGGANLIDESIAITQINETTFAISGLAALNAEAGEYLLTVDTTQIEDVFGNAGLGSGSVDWMVLAGLPTVLEIRGVDSLLINTYTDMVEVVFSEAITEDGFDWADVTLQYEGQPLVLDGTATLVELFPDTFQISGLAGLTGLEGSYTLTVDATGVQDLDGYDGIGQYQVSWMVDLTPVEILSLEQPQPDPRETAVESLVVESSEGIDLSSLDADDIILSRDNGTDLMVSGLEIETLSETQIRIGGFGLLTEADGNYVLTINGNGLTDLAGNAGINSLAVAWTVDTTAPAAPVLLGIDPDSGESNDDLKTNVTTFAVLGEVTEIGLQVSIVDLTAGENLGTSVTTDTSFRQSVTVNGHGIHRLAVTAIDVVGNVSEQSIIEIFVDMTLPQIATVTGIPDTSIAVSVQEITFTFTEALADGCLTIEDFSLTRDDTEVDLTNVTIVQDGPSEYRLTGMESVTAEKGDYVLSLVLSGVADQAGNTGQDIYQIQWSKVDVTASIGDYIWLDLDQDGLQDANELGAADVTVNLYREDGSLVDSTLSDENGYYAFKDLDPEQRYYLEVFSPTGYAFTYANSGSDDLDSDVDLDIGLSSVFAVALGENLTWDVGLVKLGSISGVVWHDVDGDGQRQDVEPLLSGWTVFLDVNGNGTLDPSETEVQTDANGAYHFIDLRAGSYIVTLLLETDWQQTHPDADGVLLEVMGEEIIDASVTLPSSEESTPDEADNSHAGLDLIGATDLWTDDQFTHLDGTGQAVVIIDTGIDLDHSFFGDDADGDGVADRIVYQYDFADDDSDASDYRGHGTNVAGIIGSSDSVYYGLASNCDLIILKVFSDSNSGQFSDVEEALQWTIANVDLYNIVAVNMSFGDGLNWDWLSATSCGCGGTVQRETYGLGDELAQLSALNVIVSAPAGNDFYNFNSEEGLNYPAADPNTISVGAVWNEDCGGPWTFSSSNATDYTTDADRIVAFSQRQFGYLDTFAPGAIITSAGLEGGTSTMQGTSQATAMVTGVAVLAQQLATEHLGRTLTLNEFRTLLQTTGNIILDGDDEDDNVMNTGQAFTRINAYQLCLAILQMDPNAVPDTGSDSTVDPDENEGVVIPANSQQAYSYTISVSQGEHVMIADFGVLPVDPPPALDRIDIVYDSVLNAQVERIDCVFSEAMAVPVSIEDAWVAEALSLLRLEASGLETSVAITSDQVSYNETSYILSIDLTEAYALEPGQYRIDVLSAGLQDLGGNDLISEPHLSAVVSWDFVQANDTNLQVTEYSVPSFADIDQDGVIDLIVGEKTTEGGKVRLYHNDGSNDTPVYSDYDYAQSNGGDLTVVSSGCLGCAPRMVDWDNDGQLDLVIGKADGTIDLYLNTGMEFGEATPVQADGADIAIGGRASLDVVDWNNDGLFDLIVGALDGKIRIYLNSGEVGTPQFDAAQIIQDGGVDLGIPTDRSSPSVFDLDGDGRKDLICGNTAGQVVFFRNIGTDAIPVFDGYELLRYDSVTIDLDGDPRSRIDIADINQDGVAEILVGSLDGLVRLYQMPIEGLNYKLFEVKDTTAPIVSVLPLTTSDTTPALSGIVDDPEATVEIIVDGQTYSATNNGDGTWTLENDTIADLAVGTYDIAVTATDLAGNIGADETLDELTIEAATPPEPVRLTDFVQIDMGGVRYNRRTGIMSLNMTITNTSDLVLTGPMRLVFDNLTPGITLANASGYDDLGRAYIELGDLLSDGTLDPGESLTLKLSFLNPRRSRLNFDWDLWGLFEDV